MDNQNKLDWFKVKVWYNGSNEAYVMYQWDTSCTLDLTYYPFDKQTCNVKVRNEVSSFKGNNINWNPSTFNFLLFKFHVAQMKMQSYVHLDKK